MSVVMRLSVVLVLALGLVGVGVVGAQEEEGAGEIAVGIVWVGDEVEGSVEGCFSPAFLGDVARQTEIAVTRELVAVGLDDEALFDHPFVVLTGQGAWALSDEQREALGRFVEGGGFVLASARCGDEAWGESMREAVGGLFEAGEDEPAAELEALAMDHAVFSALYAVEHVRVREGDASGELYGLERDGQLTMLFSPQGLNDGRNMGVGCRCCDGSGVRNARAINANALVYALTH